MLYTLGNITIDDIVIYETQELYLNTNGGNSIFSAIGALIWYQPVMILARIGQTYPRENIDQIHQAGIQTFLKQMPINDLRSWALYEPNGVRQWADNLSAGPIEDLSITGDDIPDEYLGGAGYHIAPMPTPIQLSLVKRLRRDDTIICVDAERDDLTNPEVQQAAIEMLPYLDFYLPSRIEATLLYGHDDPSAAARSFAMQGVPYVVIKMGEEGSLLYDRERDVEYHIPIVPIDALDPTGAGDTFCGGFLAGYLLTRNPVEAACYGTVSSSYVVECLGALATLESDFSESDARLKNVRSRITISKGE